MIRQAQTQDGYSGARRPASGGRVLKKTKDEARTRGCPRCTRAYVTCTSPCLQISVDG